MLKKAKISLLAIGFLTASVTFGAGCGSEPPPSPARNTDSSSSGSARSSRSKKAAAAEMTNLAKADEKEKWKYDPTDKWDPFLVPPEPDPGDKPILYDLDQMVLQGIIIGSGMDAAYIRLPDGSDQVVRLGDQLGKHGGEVKYIEKDQLIIEERYMDPDHPTDTFIIEKVMKINEGGKKRGR